jgi:hypothetical protein
VPSSYFRMHIILQKSTIILGLHIFVFSHLWKQQGALAFSQQRYHHHHRRSISFVRVWQSLIGMLQQDSNDAMPAATPAAAAAPLYITIGPPCAGKTTWISKQSLLQQPAPIRDVALDDQPGVYHPIPCRYFLKNESCSSSDDEALAEKVLLGKSVHDRIHQSTDQVELRNLLMYFSGKLTVEQLQHAIIASNSGADPVIAETLVQVAQKEMAAATTSEGAAVQLPATVDLFVREAIFRPAESKQGMHTGIKLAEAALCNTGADSAVAWGNTNTKPSDYKAALTMAQAQNRPVHFVVYKDDATVLRPNRRDDDTNQYGESVLTDDCFDLHSANFTELLSRSIGRLLRTGRYVPAGVIWDMRQRTADSVQRVIDAWKVEKPDNATTMTKFEFHRWLARMANFEMKENRTVVALSHLPVKRHITDNGWSTVNSETNRTQRRRPWDSNHRQFSSNSGGGQRDSGSGRFDSQRQRPNRHARDGWSQPSPQSGRGYPASGGRSDGGRYGGASRQPSDYNNRGGRGVYQGRTPNGWGYNASAGGRTSRLDGWGNW